MDVPNHPQNIKPNHHGHTMSQVSLISTQDGPANFRTTASTINSGNDNLSQNADLFTPNKSVEDWKKEDEGKQKLIDGKESLNNT